MAINPYEPELAKRKTTFQIAHSQLQKFLSKAYDYREYSSEFRSRLDGADEAWRDYCESAHSLAEWFEQKEADS